MFRLLAIILTALVLPRHAPAQTLAAEPDEALYDALEYRCIGPFRGGRSASVTGIPDDPMTYYFGAAGGGCGGPRTPDRRGRTSPTDSSAARSITIRPSPRSPCTFAAEGPSLSTFSCGRGLMLPAVILCR